MKVSPPSSTGVGMNSENTVGKLARVSSVVPGLGNSSLSKAIEPSSFLTVIKLLSNLPSAIACCALFWLSTARASSSSLENPSSVAIKSAQIP